MGGDLTPRWMCWFLSMIFFLYIVYELLVGLADATNKETDPALKVKIGQAQVMTVISWCTYHRWHPDRLLRLRHHLKVWCGLVDLPDLLRKVRYCSCRNHQDQIARTRRCI